MGLPYFFSNSATLFANSFTVFLSCILSISDTTVIAPANNGPAYFTLTFATFVTPFNNNLRSYISPSFS